MTSTLRHPINERSDVIRDGGIILAHGVAQVIRDKPIRHRTFGWQRFWLSLCLVALTGLAGCQTVPAGLTTVQITALKAEGFKETEDGWEFGMSDTLLFNTDQFILSDEAVRVVSRIGRTLVSVGLKHVQVYGYTDSVGRDAYNDQLSVRRADMVVAVLMQEGMSGAGITTIGAGRHNPVASNRTAAGRAQNRRVAIVISTRP